MEKRRRCTIAGITVQECNLILKNLSDTILPPSVKVEAIHYYLKASELSSCGIPVPRGADPQLVAALICSKMWIARIDDNRDNDQIGRC